ncbi:MAG: LiaF-related protein [Dehalococcoidia bacterium]|nr:LiaF-related protein [Dehalococcoidia bacterium]
MKRIVAVVAMLAAIPAVLSAIGAFAARRRQAYGDEESDSFDLVNVCRGQELVGRSQSFAGGSVFNVLGGVDVDLQGTKLDPLGAYLEVNCWLGGVDITVPAGWRVILNADTFAGGADSSAPAGEELPEDAPTLEIDAHVVLGGVSISTVEPATGTEQGAAAPA